MSEQSVHLIIRGDVQGVGYRDAMCWAAADLGVRGWVRNRRDGAVEAVIHGAAHSVAALVDWARHGPAAAEVAEIAERAATATELAWVENGFQRLPTV